MLVVLPGSVGPRRRLVDVLRAEHESRVEKWKLDTAFEAKHGIPSTPDIDWAAERRRVAALAVAVEQEDPELVRAGATAALAAMSVAPQNPGEFIEPEEMGDVVIAPRFISARDVRTLQAAYVQALAVGDREATEKAEDDIIKACIERIEGLQLADGTDADPHAFEFEAFRAAGLTPWLLVASLFFQRLTTGKAWRSGVRLPTT
jgi:hypothetical protein